MEAPVKSIAVFQLKQPAVIFAHKSKSNTSFGTGKGSTLQSFL